MSNNNNRTSVSFSIRNQGKLRKGKRYDKISITDEFEGYRDFISQLEAGVETAVEFAKYIAKEATNLTVWHNGDADDARQTAEEIHALLEWKGDIYETTVDVDDVEQDVTRASRYESQGVSSKRLLSAFAGVLQER
jgi:hypothetical protein